MPKILQEKGGGNATGCTVTIANLDEQTTEDDIVQFLADADLTAEKIDLPRESKRRRPCGSALVVLPSDEQAKLAVQFLHGLKLKDSEVAVQAVDAGLGRP